MAHPTPSRALRKPINPFRALQVHRNFRLFWSGQTVSLIGTWMQTVGQGWLALELTNSAFLVGVVSAAGSFPVLLLSLYGGVLADRRSKLRIVIICQVLLLVEAAGLWWFTWSGRINFGWLLALTTMGGLISAFALLRSLTVPRDWPKPEGEFLREIGLLVAVSRLPGHAGTELAKRRRRCR